MYSKKKEQENEKEKPKLKKVESKESLLSRSSISSNLSSTGFWMSGSRRPSFNSKIDQIRYNNKHKLTMFSNQNNSIFKKRKAKLNLESDMRWNGPNDEEFFRVFEQNLDTAIHKFI